MNIYYDHRFRRYFFRWMHRIYCSVGSPFLRQAPPPKIIPTTSVDWSQYKPSATWFVSNKTIKNDHDDSTFRSCGRSSASGRHGAQTSALRGGDGGDHRWQPKQKVSYNIPIPGGIKRKGPTDDNVSILNIEESHDFFSYSVENIEIFIRYSILENN
jgi:hypothetical protein